MRAPANPVVHLELHTGNLPRACGFYTSLFDWRAETVHVGARSYVTLGLGNRIEGGVTESDIEQPLWLPYIVVDDVTAVTRRGCRCPVAAEARRSGLADPGYGPTRLKKTLEGSLPCDWEKNGVKSFPADARPR